MEHIDVWNLVELLEGSKKGFKWVFKNKCDSLDNLEHYKAKLVFQSERSCLTIKRHFHLSHEIIP